ncbi:uncharacterized protein N7484_000242 [Penicillium longicatenatum]|uniref:uncharacterized protein n=2 Tax=Penicillium longicatenatum TaxID=1561947 RepID=UPI002546B82F|nr:uncharacterized protein N7484_000242 [Penicillium longicatenatum]KAJ5660870.1 hypothetical protein N7484_000242 [Penicillium longicatenatum]
MDLGRLNVLVARDLGLQVDSGGVLCEKGLGSDLVEMDLDLPSGTKDSESETDHEVSDQGSDKDSSEDDGPRKPRRKTGSAEGKKPAKTPKKGCGCKLTDSTIARFQGPQFERSATQQEKLKVLRHAGRSLGDFNEKKFEQDNPTWFHKKTASGAPATIFRFRPKTATPEIADFESYGLSSRDLYERCFGVLEGRDKDLASSVVESLGDLVTLEFDMYDYHFLPPAGQPRKGWSRLMAHSLVQQVVRQDPAYYAWYVMLQPDHAYRLVAWPYYTKSSYPEESTFFRHTDISLSDYLQSGRGGNLIQGSVSFTNEDPENCTEVLPRIHTHLRDWWPKVESSPKARTTGLKHRILPWMWTQEQVKKYGTDWKKIVCRAGDVRVSLPTIPHGATGPTTMIRRTVLPWYVRIEEDDECFETTESGKWEDVARSHRDLALSKKTPSGMASGHYTSPEQVFPATAQMTGLGAISDALVGRVRWSSISVTSELDVLFGKDQAAGIKFIQDWRARAVLRYKQLFQEIVVAEKRIFGENSFFHLHETGKPIPPPFLVPPAGELASIEVSDEEMEVEE